MLRGIETINLILSLYCDIQILLFGVCFAFVRYINQITPQKQPPLSYSKQHPSPRSHEPIDRQTLLDTIVAEACNDDIPIRSIRRRPAHGHASTSIPKHIKIVKGAKCPISKCETRISHQKNFKRHLKQTHGEKLRNGSYGLVRYKCKHSKCGKEVINRTIIKNHLKDQHNIEDEGKIEEIVYEIDANVKNELAEYFEGKN